MPGASRFTQDELQSISRRSVGVLRQLGPEIQWVESYVAGDNLYCVYVAPDEEMVREHGRLGSFPVNKVTEIKTVIDPHDRGVARNTAMESSFGALAWSFIVQTLSGVVAVFVGIWLALVVERRRRAEDAAEHEAVAMRKFDRAVDAVLGSVVKNTPRPSASCACCGVHGRRRTSCCRPTSIPRCGTRASRSSPRFAAAWTSA